MKLSDRIRLHQMGPPFVVAQVGIMEVEIEALKAENKVLQEAVMVDIDWEERAEKAEAERNRLREAIECNLGHISYAQFNMSEVNEMDIKGKSDSTCPEESLLIGIQGLKQALSHDKSSNR